MTNLKISSGVKDIKAMAFIGCINLSNIDLIGFIFSPS
jgi:hypothetical protein